MASYSSRLPSKPLIILFIISLVIASFNIPVIFTRQFLKLKNTIEQESEEILNKDVVISDIGFLPYGRIILNGIKIKDKKSHVSCVEIERLDARFNIFQLLMNKSALKKNKDIRFKGSAVFKKPGFIGQVNYKLDAIVAPDVISIGDMELDSDSFDIDIKGNINNYLKNPSADFNITSKEIKAPCAGMISNLSCAIKVTRNELVINHLDFFVNNFPVGVRCRISDFKSPVIEFNLASYPGYDAYSRRLRPLNFNLNFLGAGRKNSVKGKMIFEMQKSAPANPEKTFYARAVINDLTCAFSKKTLSMLAKDIVCETDALDRKINLKASDLQALLYAGKKRIYLSRLNLSMYDGVMKAGGYLDFHEGFPKLLLDFKIYKLDIAELIEAQDLRYDLKGSMDFRGVFNNKINPCLSGRVDVSDGYLKNIRLLGMVSDFLNVPSLRNTYFKSLSSLVEFSWADRSLLFNKFTVDGEGMFLNGDIKLKTTKKVNGSLSVRLSTRLLKESFKLRLLFFVVGERFPYQDFEFEIGGFINSPQLKWLSTRFKENVMKHLTESGKAALEKSIEQAMGELIK